MGPTEPSQELVSSQFSYYEGKGRHRVWLPAREIIRFKGDGTYTWLHALGQSPQLLSRSLTHYEAELPTFLRISKADLINPHFIAAVGYTGGEDPRQRRVVITLTTGERLTCSRRRGLPLIRSICFPFDSF